MFKRIRSFLINLKAGSRDRSLDRELRATLDLLTDEYMKRGLSPNEARRSASIELGGVDLIKERVRDATTGFVARTVMADIRYAFRHVRRSPAFSSAVLLTLAFGIGANTAIFTMLNTLMFRQLPIKDPGGLISVVSRDKQGRQRYIPMEMVEEIRREGPFQDVCGYNGGGQVAIEVDHVPTQALAAFVTGRCFETFGVTAIWGRTMTDEDAPLTAAGKPVVMISHRLWTRMFNSDPAAVGRMLNAEGVEMTVIGVLPPGFGGIQVDTGIDVFAPPDTIIPAPADRRPVASEILARLQPGTSLQQAAAEIKARWPALLAATVPPRTQFADPTNIFVGDPVIESMSTGLSAFRTQYGRPLTMIQGLALLLLLLACVNLGGLLLTRLTTRGTELAVRLALGGSRWRIASQMLAESLLLSTIGAALAVPMSFVSVRLLASFIPPGFVERTLTFTPDLRVLSLTAVAGIGAGVLMTALPLWIVMRRTASAQMTWDRTIVRATSVWARGLLVTQVASSVVLLVGAVLLVRSLHALLHVDSGLRTAGVITAKLMPVPGSRGGTNASYYPPMLEKIAALPGVKAAGLARLFPRAMGDGTIAVALTGQQGEARALIDAPSPGLFEAVGIPLIAGRFLDWSDNESSRQVAVVSESLARALDRSGNVLERHIRAGTRQDIVIVGVVGNAVMGNPRILAPPVLYLPPLQMGRGFSAPNLVIRADGDSAALAASIRNIVLQGGREYVHETLSLDDLFARAPSSELMSASLSAAMAGLAALMTAIGIHGAMAYSVSRRSREIGVRMAIGATPATAARGVLREGFVLTIAGVAIGLPLASLVTVRLQTLLFQVSENDFATFAGTALFLLVLGLGASCISARRAANVDPVTALKAD